MNLLHIPRVTTQVVATPFVGVYRGIQAEYLQIKQARAKRACSRDAYFSELPADKAQLWRHGWAVFVDAARETPRLYFAPLTGAIKGLGLTRFSRLH